MNGIMMIIAGGACIVVGIVIFIISIIYQKTAGKKVKIALEQEYT